MKTAAAQHSRTVLVLLDAAKRLSRCNPCIVRAAFGFDDFKLQANDLLAQSTAVHLQAYAYALLYEPQPIAATIVQYKPLAPLAAKAEAWQMSFVVMLCSCSGCHAKHAKHAALQPSLSEIRMLASALRHVSPKLCMDRPTVLCRCFSCQQPSLLPTAAKAFSQA